MVVGSSGTAVARTVIYIKPLSLKNKQLHERFMVAELVLAVRWNWF